MWVPAILSMNNVYVGVHHGEAYSKMTQQARRNKYLIGKYNECLRLFMSDEGKISELGGILFHYDLDLLKESVELVIQEKKNPIFVEIGCNKGRTSQTLINFINQSLNKFQYFGIDLKNYFSNLCPLPLGKFTFLQINSHLPSNLFPEKVDWLFIDGCHCLECVKKDIDFWSSRMTEKGVIVFHNISKESQTQRNGHDAIQVNNAIKESNLNKDFYVYKEKDQEIGGIAIYRKKENEK